MTNIAIALTGKKRSGKNTAAKVLRDILTEEGYIVHEIAFADALREAALKLDPWIVSTSQEIDRLSSVIATHGWDGFKDTAWSHSVRETLQRFGTEVVRDIDPYVWANQAMNKVNDLLLADFKQKPGYDVAFIFTDARFHNEVEEAFDSSIFDVSFLIEMRRDGDDNDDHPSETPLPEQVFKGFGGRVVDNNGELSDIKPQLLKILSEKRGVIKARPESDTRAWSVAECPECEGSGKLASPFFDRNLCQECGGWGFVATEAVV